jgi:hypothetical protein
MREIFIPFVNRPSRKEAADELRKAGRYWRRRTRDRLFPFSGLKRKRPRKIMRET